MLITRTLLALLAQIKAPTAPPPDDTAWVKDVVVQPDSKPAVTPAETGIVAHVIAESAKK